MTVYKLLFVEDKKQAVDMLRANLKDEPFELYFAYNGIEGEMQFKRIKPHLVLLDINLPKLDGMELCQRIRRSSNVPILMVSARTQDVDKAVALGLGADDYLTKPYSPIELIARIKAILRRAYRFKEPEKASKILGGPRLTLNESSHRVHFDGKKIDLSPLEYDLLHILIANPGWVFTRSHLLEKVWGYDSDNGEETVTVHISNLRKKLGPTAGDIIRTVRATGYIYEE